VHPKSTLYFMFQVFKCSVLDFWTLCCCNKSLPHQLSSVEKP
jgi:hypothetical protein